MLYFHGDHLGSTNVVSDATGVAKEIIEYEPYGQESRHDKLGTPQEVANYYFTSQYKDDESGLYFYNARYYMPLIGRFISADTIVPDSSDSQEFSRYSYVLNNPVNRTDPSGHWSWKNFWKSFAGAFVGSFVTVLTGNPGLGAAAGGAVSGGLQDGWEGALFGAQGGLFGGLIGWARSGDYRYALAGTSSFFGGVYLAAANDAWDSFAGSLAGGFAGGIGAKNLVESQRYQNWQAGNGFKTDVQVQRDAIAKLQENQVNGIDWNDVSAVFEDGNYIGRQDVIGGGGAVGRGAGNLTENERTDQVPVEGQVGLR